MEATVAAATTYGFGTGFTEFLPEFHGKNARMREGNAAAAGAGCHSLDVLKRTRAAMKDSTSPAR